jgi:serine/threonine protein kinase
MKLEPSPVNPGDVVAGKYRVDRILGQGGMGVVVAATHVELREVRALKFLLPSSLKNGESVERFRREARTVLKLKSEHVARVLDVGKLENGAPYMVMEYLHGQDLGEALKKQGQFPLEHAVLYVIQAMDAVAEAHSKGIIHRDLKPANLYLTTLPSGMPCVKVLDFGISKIAKESKEDVDMTNTSAVLGSPQFMSPEQMRASRDVDPRTDIWALGVILYQLTTGKLPFRGRSSTEIIANMFTIRPEPPSRLVSRLPPKFDDVVMRCLRLEPADRFATIAELAQALAPLAPPAASFTLERILRYGSPNALKTGTGLPAADLGSGGASEDLFPPNPHVPGDWVASANGETNPNETISSAPTRVMAGAALDPATILAGRTEVMPGSPNKQARDLGASGEVTKLMPSKANLPLENPAAGTNSAEPPPRKRHISKTELISPELLQHRATESQASAPVTGSTSNSGAGAWGGTQTLSYGHQVSPKSRVGFIVLAAVSVLVILLVAIGFVSSGNDETRPKHAGPGLSGATSGSNATPSASALVAPAQR